MELSKSQNTAINLIKKMNKHCGTRWFIQAELPGISKSTLHALVERDYLRITMYNDLTYYKWFRA